jgi:K+-transporting ATPase KdpF subunit
MNTFLLIGMITDVIPAKITGFQSGGYLIGAFLAILILGYLVYSLVKPEDF